ncbi:hypothetical protein [Roseomonas indoligenes]|uniref:Uncharacterized protein n=1 Tax=Roseomonas indoligenes TaxID=2820811 RepID=A0A940N2I3_9PROT|nr:hypothetical protein [Pararoseomonas indoligenes]MBP0493027.1 hypothetical protein [Pararoseomonas indoligenes]
MASSTCPTADDARDNLDQLLDELIATFNWKELPRALLSDAGVVLIRRLADAGEAEERVALWRKRWCETVRLEAVPLRKPNPS